jgi:hypothetical protein
MRRRGRRRWVVPTEAAPPLSPILNKSFLVVLLVFCPIISLFIIIYRPVPFEGHIHLTLPGADSALLPNQHRYVFRVTATNSGAIASITLRQEDVPGEKALGADVGQFLGEAAGITARERMWPAAANGAQFPQPKLTIEIGGKLAHVYVVELLNAAIQGGFANSDILLVPIDTP